MVENVMVYENARDLWPALISRAGLDVPAKQSWLKKLLGRRWRHRTSWYDKDLVDDLRRQLSLRGVGYFEDLLDRADPPVSADDLLWAFLKSLQPFSMMKQDILEMMSAAGAQKGEKNIRIRFHFDRSDDPLDLLLGQFREQMEIVEQCIRTASAASWDVNRIWDVLRIPQNHPHWPQGRLHGPFATSDQEIGDWVASVWSTHRFSRFPASWRTGDRELDRRIGRVVGVLEDMLSAFRRYGADYAALSNAAASPDADTRMDPIGLSIRRLSSIEHDYWSATVGEWVLKARQAYATSGRHSSLIGTIISEIDQLFPESGERKITESVRSLMDVLNLPVWKKRNEVYAVWVSTQIWRALKDAWRFHFHVKDGTLSFSFSGVHLATLLSARHDEILLWWTELRTPADNLPSGHRLRAIQPDFRILRAPLSRTDSDVLVVEVKQYMRGGTSDFAAALADYTYACPRAVVMLVNYGPVNSSALAAVPPSTRHRARAFGHVRPDLRENCIDLQEAIEEFVDSATGAGVAGANAATVARIARIELRWGARPSDLDLHLFPVPSAEDGKGHVYYAQKQYGTVASLQNDVTTGHGPEVISLADVTGKFLVCVHQYSSDGHLRESTAMLDIFSVEAATGTVTTFRCPSGGAERWWLVCEIDCSDGSIREIAKLAHAPEWPRPE